MERHRERYRVRMPKTAGTGNTGDDRHRDTEDANVRTLGTGYGERQKRRGNQAPWHQGCQNGRKAGAWIGERRERGRRNVPWSDRRPRPPSAEVGVCLGSSESRTIQRHWVPLERLRLGTLLIGLAWLDLGGERLVAGPSQPGKGAILGLHGSSERLQLQLCEQWRNPEGGDWEEQHAWSEPKCCFFIGYCASHRLAIVNTMF